MEGFTKTPPKPRPVEYSRSFTKDEIEKALKFYLEHHDVPIPKGSSSVSFHEEDPNYYKGPCKRVTLTIEVFE
jgi:hypothetical protein